MIKNKQNLSSLAGKVGKSFIVLIETTLICVYIHNPILSTLVFMAAIQITNIALDYLIPFSFYFLTNQHEKASQLGIAMMEKLRRMFTAHRLSETLLKILLAIVFLILSIEFSYNIFQPMLMSISAYFPMITAFWKATALRVSTVFRSFFVPFWKALASSGCTQFRCDVIVAPLTEEVMFRGVIQNSIKLLFNLGTLCVTFVKNSFSNSDAQAPKMVTVQQPENANDEVTGHTGENTKQDMTNCYSAIASVTTTALLFSACHHLEAQPKTFVTGGLYGTLHENFDDEYDDYTISVAAHMTNNFIATTA